MTPDEFAREGRRLSDLLDAALRFNKEQIPKAAAAERDYRKAKSELWVRAKTVDMLAKEKETWVDAQSADLRYERDVAEGMLRVGYQAVKSRQQQISLLQSQMNVFKAEANFAQFGIEVDA